MKLPDSTAYDMIFPHQIRIGERKDPSVPDPREEEEEEKEEQGEPKSRASTRKKSPPPSKVVLLLKGEFAQAVKELRTVHGYKDDKTTIIETVLSVHRQLTAPLQQGVDGKHLIVKEGGDVSEAA